MAKIRGDKKEWLQVAEQLSEDAEAANCHDLVGVFEVLGSIVARITDDIVAEEFMRAVRDDRVFKNI